MIVFISTALFGMVWTSLETLFFWSTLPNFDLMYSLQFKPRMALTYTVTLLAWSAIYFGIKYWKQVQVEHQNTLHAKILAETAQLEMLRYQVNPHFLFNALNSIRASISPDNPAAKQMITQLSEFLRHSLMSNDKNQNTLSDELEAVENYLAIEKIRFEEALEVELNIDDKAKQIMLPSFLLNPLVENAIKHGLQTSPEILKINISAVLESDRLVIEVKNSGRLNAQKTDKKDKIGLNNVQERLKKQLPNKSSFALYEENGCVVARIEILQ
ncbi:two-component system, LytT family, sensor kinase [Paraglaciecola arctica BSs20135]|uniref:Two-component system, LytT family, sensor kinase n=1 Tax=Paraglaciecola arctica BSs20135 TaxID=493475 RepID=K6Y160_9ALTE|nr:two-component system, LytT family, sensor kinase [Paraglaciecola arctica BSs20135]